MKKLLKTKLAVIIVVLVGITALGSILTVNHWMQSSISQLLQVDSEHTFDVKKGASLTSILDALETKGTITTDFFLKLHLRLNRKRYVPKSGHYALNPGQSLQEFLSDLSNGKEKTYSITMVEGLTWKQWYAQLQENPVIVQDATPEQLMEILNLESDSLEGLLLPETYNVRYGTKLSEFVLRMHADMQAYLSAAWENRQGLLPLASPYEALILASIVEKETGLASERPRISAVFVNRLRNGMRLQTDPTVIYGLGDRFDGDIKRSHLREKTAYNTYVIDGLPPTPIAMVGKAAIDSALNPDYSDEFYFVARGDGSHQFSKTLKEHNIAVRKFQLGL